jgi:hypothetical protein
MSEGFDILALEAMTEELSSMYEEARELLDRYPTRVI